MGLFDIITDPIENVLDIGDALLSGEDITKRQVAKLINDGMTVAAIAAGTGMAVDVIEALIEDD